MLSRDDVAPFTVISPEQPGNILLTCEHAGRAIPEALGDLGIAKTEMERHIAYDIGAADLAIRMREKLAASLVMQNYSRLVIDCNRPLSAPDCMPERSDGTLIPANLGLSDSDREQRYKEIHQPYHCEIIRILDAGQSLSQPPILVSIHSFTPSLAGVDRPWHLGLLYHRDPRLAHAMMDVLHENGVGSDFNTAFNEPYAVDDDSDYTIPVHGEARGIVHVLLEVRNNELETPTNRQQWADLLSRALQLAIQEIQP